MTIIWNRDERGIIGWAADRLLAILPRRVTKPVPGADGSHPDIFLTQFEAPLPPGGALRKATLLALPQLLPVTAQDLVVFGRSKRGVVDLAALRLSDLENPKFRKLKRLTLDSDWITLTPKAMRRSERQLATALLAFLVLIASLAMLQARLLDTLDVELQKTQDAEQQVRSTARAAALARNQADLWASLRASDPQSRSPAQVLAAVSQMSRLTPDHSYWTKLNVTGPVMTFEGRSKDPVDLLASLSSMQGGSARFSKPVTPVGDGTQQFEIEIAPVKQTALK